MDAVIIWTDREDPRYRERHGLSPLKDPVHGDENDDSDMPDGLSEAVLSLGRCLSSLNKYSSGLRCIYLITDGQDPGPAIEPYISGERRIPIRLIDHKELFRGYESLLPNSNPLSIRTMIWNLPELSENFLLIEPDTELTAPVSATDFFTPDGRIKLRAARRNVRLTVLLNGLRSASKNNDERLTLSSRLNVAELIGSRHFFDFKFGILPLLKSGVKEFLSNRPELMEENISYREPDPYQFCPVELCYLLAESSGHL